MDTPPVAGTTGIITTDQIGEGDSKLYGADIAPNGPVQDMTLYDPIVGVFPPQERNASPPVFTGGMGGHGLGGEAEGMSPGGVGEGSVFYERRGF